MRLFKTLIVIVSVLFSTGSWSNAFTSDMTSGSADDFTLKETGYMSFLMERGVRFFQVFISPVDGDRCQMAPTCSAFGRKAFQEHGAFWGFILTFDRLTHEGDESSVSPYIYDGDRLVTFDPVENNVFLWNN